MCWRWTLLEWLIGCDPGSSAMAVSQRKGQDFSSYSVHKTGCLSSPNLVLETYILKELLVFSLRWPLKEMGSTTNVGEKVSATIQISLSESMRVSRQKVNDSLLNVLLHRLPPEGVVQI